MTQKEFLSYFPAEHFIPDLKATTKNAALSEIVAHLATKGRLKSPSIVLEALLKRESLGSTGIGKSLAVPHGRTTVVNSLTVLYARSEEGIPWESIDDAPVHFVFLILAPHQERENNYLPLLGRIVEVARDATVRRKLKKADSHEAFLAVLEAAKAAK